MQMHWTLLIEIKIWNTNQYQLFSGHFSVFFREILEEQLVANSSFASSRTGSNGAPCRVAKIVQQPSFRLFFWCLGVLPQPFFTPSDASFQQFIGESNLSCWSRNWCGKKRVVFNFIWMPPSLVTFRGSKWPQSVREEMRGVKRKQGYFVGAWECLTWRKHRSGDPPPCWLCLLSPPALQQSMQTHPAHPCHTHFTLHTLLLKAI